MWRREEETYGGVIVYGGDDRVARGLGHRLSQHV